MRQLIIFLIIFSLLGFIITSAEGDYKLRPGGRPLGMGGAYTALAFDGNALWWNPAGLSFLTVQEVDVGYRNLYPGIIALHSGQFGFILPFGTGGTMGLDFCGIDHAFYREGSIGLSYAYQFRWRRQLSIGTTLNVPYKAVKSEPHIESDPLFQDGRVQVALGINLGLLLRWSEHLSIGAMFRNINEPNIAFDENVEDKIPRETNLGIAYQYNLWSIKMVNAIDYSWRNREINGERDKSLRFGMESWFLNELLAFRWGFNDYDANVGFSTKINKEAMPIQVDYAFTVPTSDLRQHWGSHMLSVRIQFGREGGHGAEISIDDFNMIDLFSAMYKYYADKPIANVTIKNETSSTLKNIKIGLLISEVMDFSTDVILKELAPYSEQNLLLNATFNNKILEIEEDTPTQAQLIVNYHIAGQAAKRSISKTFLLYSRNAMNWQEQEIIANFITPKNRVINEFTRNILSHYADENAAIFNKNLFKAMELFDGLGVYGISYIVDPSNPYNGASLGTESIDYVQYPNETLKLKSGDCDDCSVLLCSVLENAGIETALIDIPGHVFIAFTPDLTEAEAINLGFPENTYFILNDKIWLPIEATSFRDGFTVAWNEGNRKYKQYKEEANIILIHKAWEKYIPATLPPENWSAQIPTKEKLDEKIKVDRYNIMQVLFEKELERLQNQLQKEPNNPSIYNSLGVIYGKSGIWENALKSFSLAIEKSPNYASAYNNIGNIYYRMGKYNEALESYEKSAELDPNDGGIHYNIALTYIKLANEKKAHNAMEEAIKLHPSYKNKYYQMFPEE